MLQPDTTLLLVIETRVLVFVLIGMLVLIYLAACLSKARNRNRIRGLIKRMIHRRQIK